MIVLTFNPSLENKIKRLYYPPDRLHPVLLFSWKNKYGSTISYTGWWFQPLWKILVSWDDYSQHMGKQIMFQTTNQSYFDTKTSRNSMTFPNGLFTIITVRQQLHLQSCNSTPNLRNPIHKLVLNVGNGWVVVAGIIIDWLVVSWNSQYMEKS